MIAQTLLPKKLQQYHDKIWPLTAHQRNSNTRHWEYPWIMDQIEKYCGYKPYQQLSIAEIGGGNSCLQFYYGLKGVKYTNIECSKELCNTDIAQKMGISIKYIYGNFEYIDIALNAYDIVVCASVLEHTNSGSESGIIKNIAKCLRFGGIGIFTVDWFFDFQIGDNCKWGRNVNCKKIIEFGQKLGLRLEVGEKQYISGYPEFNEKLIKKNLLIPKVCNDGIWVTSQAFVLKK